MNEKKHTCVVVGCGGTGGWLTTCLTKMLNQDDEIILMDADTFEAHNRDRQLHCKLGANKADALKRALERAAKVTFTVVREFLDEPTAEIKALVTRRDPDIVTIFCGADNHRARLNTLKLADDLGCHAVICGNGYTDAEAYYYQFGWRNTELDPRVFYPELLSDTTGDPLSPPCTGEILESAPQLALANMSAANYGMWLWYFWTQEAPKITADFAVECNPYFVSSSAGRMNLKCLKDA